MDYDSLNNEQLKATTFNGKHLLVLAGAGTGKTRTIIARAVHLIDNGANPKRIKILSFTKKSANEIVERIKTKASNRSELKDLSGSTFHSWCMDLITSYPKIFGLQNYTCIDEEDRENAFKFILGNVVGKKSFKDSEDTRIKADSIVDVYSYAINTKVNLSTAIRRKIYNDFSDSGTTKKIDSIKNLISDIIIKYQEYKKSRHYIDYDDMLNVVAVILKRDDKIKNAISSLYDHILVDEMQDTNPLQWELLESFFDKCHLFCVGDDAQSIYAFRGADFKSIHSFQKRVPDSTVYKLEENFRSTQEILDISNWLLDTSPLNYDKHLVANRGKGNKPIMIVIENDYEEAEFITSKIVENFYQGKHYNDHMVLSRTISGTRQIEAACISKKIPYIIFGGTGLMRSAHIRDVVSALRIIANFRDELAWVRYLLLWEGVGEKTASMLIEKILVCDSIDDCIHVLQRYKPQNSSMITILSSIQNMQNRTDEAIDAILSRIDKILGNKYDNWSYRKTDFNALKAIAKKSAGITSFITDYILDPALETTDKRRSNCGDDVVTISTIHSAKGLEADTCFVINVSPFMFPSVRAKTDDEVEEERRCLYVALTRAKNMLYITSSRKSIRVDYSDEQLLKVGATIIKRNDVKIKG